MYSHDFLLSRERFRVFGLDALSVGFWVTDMTRRSMISSVASSCELAVSSLATDMFVLSLPTSVWKYFNISLHQKQVEHQLNDWAGYTL